MERLATSPLLSSRAPLVLIIMVYLTDAFSVPLRDGFFQCLGNTIQSNPNQILTKAAGNFNCKGRMLHMKIDREDSSISSSIGKIEQARDFLPKSYGSKKNSTKIDGIHQIVENLNHETANVVNRSGHFPEFYDGKHTKKITEKGKAKQKNGKPRAISMFVSSKYQPMIGLPFLIPWSFWLQKGPLMHGNSYDDETQTTKRPKRKRWEVPLTSKPFQGYENLRSTVLSCLVAIGIYFLIGTSVFPLWLEPGWTFIDSLYFSMVTLTTVGYGDLVVSTGISEAGTILKKVFVMFFNIYAVCISVSALSIIAKLALVQQRRIISKAKEKARESLIQMFDVEEDDEDDDDEEGEEDEEEECRWIDHIYDDRCDPPEAPLTIHGVLIQSIKRQSLNFVGLILLAAFLKKVEGWSIVDVFYYWNSTASTIGFGDLAPKSQAGRLLAVIFIPLSVVTLGEVIANCFAVISSKVNAKAEKDFLRREITLSDLEYLDIDEDGKVCELDFVTFMLVAMQKVDKKTMKDLSRLFNALDVGKDGFIQKEDLILLRQRKRLAKKLRRDARKRKKWFEEKTFF